MDVQSQGAASFTSPLAGEVGPHRRCDPGEGFCSIDRPEPLTPTLSHKGRGGALPLSQHFDSNLHKTLLHLHPGLDKT
jgi:hypothetical protein